MAVKLNVNIRTLLTGCEEMCRDEKNFARLRNIINALQTMIEELAQLDDTQSNTTLKDYRRRLQSLKQAVHFVEETPLESGARLTATHDAYGDGVVSELKQVQSAQEYASLRQDLFNDRALRQRHAPETSVSSNSGDGLNEAVRYNASKQEQIAEHMIALTRNLREQTVIANRIIKRDTEVATRTASLADNNISSLGKETNKLEQHSRKAYRWWMWTWLALAFFVFIATIFFMQIVTKR